MVEIILWSVAVTLLGAAAGFCVGWQIGRRRLRRKLRDKSTADRFLSLLNY